MARPARAPEEIVALYPQLSLADVHAALTYYLDHRAELEDQASVDQAEFDAVASVQGQSQFAQLRDQLFGNNRNNEN